MKVIDLSHTINSEITIYPGDEPPFIEQIRFISDQGYNETKLSIQSHTGTHIDAPLHMIINGKSLNGYEIGIFIGRAGIIDLESNKSEVIELNSLFEYERLIEGLDFLIIRTGWSKYWGTEKYLNGYPVLTSEAAKWLTNFKLRGIGIDAISVDNPKECTYPIHHILFEKDILIIENLTNLSAINKTSFIFNCLPIKYENADGSPIRAIGIIE